MRRVDRELGYEWEEPEWRSEPYRLPRLAKLLDWHDLRANHDLLSLFPYANREWFLSHSFPFDSRLKCYYNPSKIQRMRTDSVFFRLIPRSR